MVGFLEKQIAGMNLGTLVEMEKPGKSKTFRTKRRWADLSRVCLFDSRTISCFREYTKSGTGLKKDPCPNANRCASARDGLGFIQEMVKNT